MATKNAPIKSASKRTKKSSKASAKKTAQIQSFRVAKDDQPFVTFKITRQTVYWIILLGVIAISQLWIIKLQLDISTLTEAITALQQV